MCLASYRSARGHEEKALHSYSLRDVKSAPKTHLTFGCGNYAIFNILTSQMDGTICTKKAEYHRISADHMRCSAAVCIKVKWGKNLQILAIYNDETRSFTITRRWWKRRTVMLAIRSPDISTGQKSESESVGQKAHFNSCNNATDHGRNTSLCVNSSYKGRTVIAKQASYIIPRSYILWRSPQIILLSWPIEAIG